jgi:hypothetical protein
MGIALDKYIALEKAKSPEQLHQHVHLHGDSEVNDLFKQALKPK